MSAPPPPLKILLIEDSDTDARLVTHELRRLGRPFEVKRVQDAEALRAALRGDRWDVVLSDWSLPGFNAPEALQIVKELSADVPFIIVSGTVGEETAVAAMKSGVHDYVLKDRLARLVPAIERELAEAVLRTERRRGDEALKVSEMRFRRLFEARIIGIAIATLDGEIREVNDAFLTMTARARADVVAPGRRWTDFASREGRAAAEAAVGELRRTGVATPWELELVAADGQVKLILMGVAMIDATQCILFAADLSARRRMELALRESEAQLRHAQKMEAVGRLAGGVAHDFNNILSVILAYSDLLIAENEHVDGALVEGLHEIRRAGARAADLTRRLLAFSRRQPLAPRVVEINQVVESMEMMLRRLIGADVALVSSLAPGLPPVSVDPGQMEQVIMNLAVNARDAMPRGGTLTLATSSVRRHGPRPGSYVVITVTDTGTGMDETVLARIFEPFFTTKEEGRGTGLGLSTVLGIVEQSGGHLEVQSAPGVGTTFHIFMPRATSQPTVELPAAPGGPRRRATEMVLLVDDDDQIRQVSRLILTREGYRVLDASSGADALVCCEKYSDIDLVLIDSVMPHMSGSQLMEALRAARPGLRIAFMTGYVESAAATSFPLDVLVIQKPIRAETLLAGVRAALEAPAAC